MSDLTVLSVIWIVFSGLFRFSRIYSIYNGDLAEPVALAITSIRCNVIVATSRRHAIYCYAGRQFESNYLLNVCTIAHFLSSSLVLAVWELWGANKVDFQLETSAFD